jgi:hypothetical protein
VLANTECFGRYSSTGSLNHVDRMVDTTKSTAPRWVSILQNSSYPPTNPTGEVPFGDFTVTLSILRNHMHRNASDTFPVITSAIFSNTPLTSTPNALLPSLSPATSTMLYPQNHLRGYYSNMAGRITDLILLRAFSMQLNISCFTIIRA